VACAVTQRAAFYAPVCCFRPPPHPSYPWHPPLQGDSEWLVVDAGSVVAHVFLEGHRQEYALEELWGLPDGSNIRRVAPKATLHTLDTLQ
jgi:hypothetical protein